MKTLFKPAAAALCLCASSLALANGSQTGTITNLYIRSSDGLVYFILSGTASTKPGCATNPYWIIKNENSTTGKQQLALLLMARAQGNPISVTGTGACTRWSDGEDVDLMNLSGN